MSLPLFPDRDADLLTALQTFASGIAADPAKYSVSAPDSAAITASVDAFAAALADARDPATRSPVSVAVKSQTRSSSEQLCRQFAIQIKYNGGISDADKIAIGVKPVNNSRSPIHVPETSPLLAVIAATPGLHTVRYADSTTPDSGAKPFGAINLQLFVGIGPAALTDPSAAPFYGAFTKNPVGVKFDAADSGKLATYFARWQSRKGDVGPGRCRWPWPSRRKRGQRAEFRGQERREIPGSEP